MLVTTARAVIEDSFIDNSGSSLSSSVSESCINIDIITVCVSDY